MLVNELDGRYQELSVSPYGIKAMLLGQRAKQFLSKKLAFYQL